MDFPLGSFDSNQKNLKSTDNTNTISVNFNGFNTDYFFESMKHIDQISDNDLIMIIKNFIDLIVDRTLSDDESIGSILCNPRFVAAYYKAITTIPIDYDRRLFCNKMTYEYSIIENPNPAVLNTFKEISKYVNKDIVTKLNNIGLNSHIANDLVVSRFSSRHENVNIQRLNFTICKYNAELFSDQTIVWVYEQLFDRIGDLFIYSMLEVYSDEELDDLGGDFRDIYSNISLAILVILNNMPSNAIRQVIERYVDEYQEWVKNRMTIPRFTLRSLSDDYNRIVTIVDKLLAEGVNVP